jgi:hypothetical protein
MRHFGGERARSNIRSENFCSAGGGVFRARNLALRALNSEA